MLADFFLLGDRKYINNAIVIADCIKNITAVYNNIRDFRIQFKKPFLTQGEFNISTEKLDGCIVGQFTSDSVLYYFSYVPTEIPLEIQYAIDTISKSKSPLALCYHITDMCRGVIEQGFESKYGAMTQLDKVIFVIFEIPDMTVFTNALGDTAVPGITVGDVECIAERKFKVPVFVDSTLLGYRYSTVKEFKI